jgi:dolichyl-phosphate beta-glucosyltransferase
MVYSVIIPAYNEAASIERAIRETSAVFNAFNRPYEILVVDDGSQDGTGDIAELMGQNFPVLNVLRHQTNLGKGAAVRTGVMNAQGERLLFLDSDLATHPREATAFIAALEDADIVIGSRRAKGSVIATRQPWYRILYGRAINFFIRNFLKLPHQDTQCGFKMFRAGVARDLFGDLVPSRWTFDVELLLRARANGYRVTELPVTWTDGRVSRVKAAEVLSDLWYLIKIKNKLNK